MIKECKIMQKDNKRMHQWIISDELATGPLRSNILLNLSIEKKELNSVQSKDASDGYILYSLVINDS